MWFRNLSIFQYGDALKLDAARLAERLMEAEFQPCGSYDLVSRGWVPPLGRKAVDFLHKVSGYLLLCLQVEEKLLPAAVVKEIVANQVAEIEDREMRSVFRKEKERLRDEALQELLPRAFTRVRKHYAYIDTHGGWLIVDSASKKAVEELTAMLRTTLGSLPIKPLQVADAPSVVMTGWLTKGELPPGFVLEDECELRDPGEEGGLVRCKGQDLVGDEVGVHLKAGKQVTRLALSWDERIAFLLQDDLTLRRLRFLDLVQEQVGSERADTAEQVFDAEFALMTGELTRFLASLLEGFGGVAPEA